VGETNDDLRRLVVTKQWSAAAELALTLPDIDLNGYPNHELWWHFAEELADRLAVEDPNLARRLFGLVESSYMKEASMASAAAEAASVQHHLVRVRRKLVQLSC
jgi:hypothetical protein